jgi:soluble lytic murein transglycosylase
MSSMWRIAAMIPVLLATAPSSSAQYAAPANIGVPAYRATQSVASSLQTWRTLRQSSNYRFADYASFLIANPDWPVEA